MIHGHHELRLHHCRHADDARGARSRDGAALVDFHDGLVLNASQVHVRGKPGEIRTHRTEGDAHAEGRQGRGE
jgi:hypothetical protein